MGRGDANAAAPCLLGLAARLDSLGCPLLREAADLRRRRCSQPSSLFKKPYMIALRERTTQHGVGRSGGATPAATRQAAEAVLGQGEPQLLRRPSDEDLGFGRAVASYIEAPNI